MPKKSVFLPAALAAAFLLSSCTVHPPPEPGGQLTGRVYDSATGEPLQGATLRFGGLSAQSGSDGSFAMSLGESGETLVAAWLLFKPDYQFLYVQRVSIDSSRSWQLSLPLRKADPQGYPTVGSLEGELRFADGSGVPEASAVQLDIYGSKGTHNRYACQSSGSRYSVELKERPSDCLVVLRVEPVAGDAFVAMAQAADLSGLSPVELDFQEEPEGLVVVQATASRGGNQGSCFFSTSYGLIPGWFQRPGAPARVLQSWEFAATGPEPVPVCNPFAWNQVFWVQREEDETFPCLPEHRKFFMSSTALAAFSETASLPAPDRTLGPGEGAVAASLQLNGALLSLAPAAGAGLYSFSFREDGAPECLWGTVLSFDCSVMLPELLIGALGGRSLEVGFQVMDSRLAALGTELLQTGEGFPPGLQVGMVEGSGAAAYQCLLEIPAPGGIGIGIE
jgi:hypothetical protein